MGAAKLLLKHILPKMGVAKLSLKHQFTLFHQNRSGHIGQTSHEQHDQRTRTRQ